MTPENGRWDVYEKVCKDRFEKIEDQLEAVEKQVTNDIPHKIDMQFWKMVGFFGPIFLGILWILIRHVVNGG